MTLLSSITFPSALELIGNLKAALRVVSQDETRPHLNALYIVGRSVGLARFVATDGHRLWLNETRITSTEAIQEGDLLLARADVERLIKLVDRKGSAVTFTQKSGLVDVGQGGGRVMQIKAVDSTFPTYAHGISGLGAFTGGAAKVRLTASYLADAAACFKDLMTGAGLGRAQAGMSIENGPGELDPVAITCIECPDALYVTGARRAQGPSERFGAADLVERYRRVS